MAAKHVFFLLAAFAPGVNSLLFPRIGEADELDLPAYVFQGKVPSYKQDGHKVVFGPTDTHVALHSDHWTLQKVMLNPRRNHDTLILNGTLMINILGRWAHSVELMDLLTGNSSLFEYPDSAIDPLGNPLGDLNHVNAVLLDTLENNGQQEIWLPCGFHGDVVNAETSSSFVRIVDVGTWTIRAGPRMPRSGGACTALALHLEGPDKPAHICAFGGTDGSHDEGEYLDTVQCFDRQHNVWNQPFGNLPLGLDHANAVFVPSSAYGNSRDVPSRVMLMNFRTMPYGPPHPEILAFDMPRWPMILGAQNVSGTKGWYVFSNPWRDSVSAEGVALEIDELNMTSDVRLRQESVLNTAYRTTVSINHGRDASGVVTASGGRYIINIGGVAYTYPDGHEGDFRHRHPHPFSDVRVLDVTDPSRWTKTGDISVPEFALQSCSSKELGVIITCGGASPVMYRNREGPETIENSNMPYCMVNHFRDIGQSNGLNITIDGKPGVAFSDLS